MSETILRINVTELKTVRLKNPDGTITEMPVGCLTEEHRKFPNASVAQLDALRNLGQAITALTRDGSMSVEFVLPAAD